MSFKNTWLIWIPLILLLIFAFPKSCGNKNPSEYVEYSCAGFKAPFLSEIRNQDNPQEWCSGICLSKIKKMIESNKTNENISSDQTPFSGFGSSLEKVIPLLLGIFIIVGILKWVGTFKKKNAVAEIKVYKSP